MAIIMAVPGAEAGLICDAYVLDCDVDARGGRGHIQLTVDRSQAKRFTDAGDALAFWNRQSTVLPLRTDGKPNKPLTAYTVDLQRVDP